MIPAVIRLMTIGILLAAVSLHAAKSKFPFPPHPSKPVPPNVIWIIANDLGYGDVGPYGQTKIKTANIDRMAREGMMFTRCYVANPENITNRVSLLTGRDHRKLDLLTNSPVLIEPGMTTIGQVMQRAGYRNGYIGKWLLGKPRSYSQPQRKGFNDWIGELQPQAKTDFYPDTMWRFDPDRKFEGLQTWGYNIGGRRGLYLNEFFRNSMTNYVRIHFPNRWNRFVPFFQIVSFALPNPLDIWQGNTNRFSAVPNTGRYVAYQWPRAEQQKAAAITLLDSYLGELFKVLEKHQQVKNTAVILTSDGGPFTRGGSDPKFFRSAGPFRGGHGDLTEGGVRVPMIVRWPGTVQSGTTNDLLISHLDLLSTTAGIGKTKPPADVDGISFLPSLLGWKQTNRHNLLVWNRSNRLAAVQGNWKATQDTNSMWQLFDLKADPSETNNIAKTKPQILQSITNAASKWIADRIPEE